jgi:23S rRNA (cytosine1962-C5)-methyltransferase
VLDLFCYSGGFSLAAARLGEAREVLGVDSSKKAIAAARANGVLNGAPNVRFESGEAFQTLESLSSQGERFDAIVLDPPKFTRTRKGAAAALQAYFRLNRRAVELLAPGGILVTCSCSGGVLREDFLQMLAGVSQKSARDVQILEQRGASPDHPVSASCLETEYLKCFICRVS